MKPNLSLILLYTFILSFSCSTKIEEESWKGAITQDDNFGISNSYKSTLKWKNIGNTIVGEGYYEASHDTSMNVLYSFEGAYDGDTIRLRETGVIHGTAIPGEWVTKDIVLYFTNASKTKIEGRWVAQRLRNIYGTSKYSKVE